MRFKSQRAKVVEVARSWIGTPYHHHAKIKGVGCDCVTMIAAVYEEAGIRDAIEVGKYARGWHLHHEEPLYEKGIIAYGGREVSPPQIGDIVLYLQAKTYAHGGIITRVSPLRFVQAFLPARKVVEGDETEFGVLCDKPRKFFSLW